MSYGTHNVQASQASGNSVPLNSSSQRSRLSGPGPIQYVFVDESQRDSKRIKITRACEGCRKRKVKCDAPRMFPEDACTSCRRLGIECLLQQSNAENSFLGNDVGPVSRSSADDEEDMLRSNRFQFATSKDASTKHRAASVSPQSAPEILSTGYVSQLPYKNSESAMLSPTGRTSHTTDGPRNGFSDVERDALPSLTPLTNPYQNGRGPNTLTSIFGGLDIHVSGRAAFLEDAQPRESWPGPKSGVVQAPGGPHEERKSKLRSPEYPVSYEQIEPILPEDDLALSLLDIYFRDIHQYVPVLDKAAFYRDWLGTGRRTLSPFLLLSIFAAAARISDDPRVFAQAEGPSSRGDIWQQAICRMREDFHDAPRLDTVQAELINLKAFEDRPNIAGFLYRGWFQLGCIVRMGRDLGLHRISQRPTTDPDSNMGRRVWQVCFIMDQFMGTAQGRDFQLDLSELDMTFLSDPPPSGLVLSSEEVKLQNDFVHMTTLVRILRRCSIVHATTGIKYPFAAEPQRPILSETLLRWRSNLPEHLTFHPALDKKLPSQFVGNIHVTYCLNVCLLHRAWIVSAGDYGATGEWRVHLRVCHDAARQATIIFEMILNQYGPAGIKGMIRGYNLALYSALIMAMIHAISLTCPEKEFCEGASEYFTRIMNVLDRLQAIFPNDSLQRHLSTIRNIFNKPQSINGPSAMQDLPPDLLSLQHQYELAQRERRASEKSGSTISTGTRSSHSDYRLAGFSDTSGRFGVSSASFPSMPYRDAQYSTMHLNMTDNMGLDPSQQDSSSHPMQMTSPTATQWNPAGLIGAWNLNFPIGSTGMNTSESANLITDMSLRPSAQALPYYDTDHMHGYSQSAPASIDHMHGYSQSAPAPTDLMMQNQQYQTY